MRARLATHGLAPGRTQEDYEKRLAFELDVIVNMTFAGYFLIVADFIQWAKAQGIPVGPGRGSGAGSVVAWALTITDLDPLRFGLLFERFLNPERVSMPDFDIDFCQERRDEVIAYVRERYGDDRVAQIITFGSFLARGVVRNVGRVLEMPLGQVDKLAKLVPQNPTHPVTLKQAVADEARLQEAAKADEKVAQMLAIAERLEGPLFQRLDPCRGRRHRRPAADRTRAALPRSEIGDAGDAVQHEMGRTGRADEVRLSRPEDADGPQAGDRPHRPPRRSKSTSSKIPLDDAKTYEALGRGETVGVFQVESGGMRRALVEMRADRFEDIIALVALYRPGPMANISIGTDCPALAAAEVRSGRLARGEPPADEAQVGIDEDAVAEQEIEERRIADRVDDPPHAVVEAVERVDPADLQEAVRDSRHGVDDRERGDESGARQGERR